MIDMTKCIVKDCTNTSSEGVFIGNMCAPCYRILTTGQSNPTNSILKTVGLPNMRQMVIDTDTPPRSVSFSVVPGEKGVFMQLEPYGEPIRLHAGGSITGRFLILNPQEYKNDEMA